MILVVFLFFDGRKYTKTVITNQIVYLISGQNLITNYNLIFNLFNAISITWFISIEILNL